MFLALPAMAAHLIVTIHSLLITIQSRALVRFMLYKHPVDSFATVVREANLSAQQVGSDLHARACQQHSSQLQSGGTCQEIWQPA